MGKVSFTSKLENDLSIGSFSRQNFFAWCVENKLLKHDARMFLTICFLYFFTFALFLKNNTNFYTCNRLLRKQAVPKSRGQTVRRNTVTHDKYNSKCLEKSTRCKVIVY